VRHLGVVCAGKAGDGVEQDDDVVAEFHHAPDFSMHHLRDLDMSAGVLVER
jgi:hypothetical protein